MADPYRYGDLEPVPFKIVDSNGKGVTGISFAASDVQLTKSGGAYTNVGTQCSEVGRGLYIFTPSGTQTQTKWFALTMKDASSPEAWEENCVIFYTGGSINAFYDGT